MASLADILVERFNIAGSGLEKARRVATETNARLEVVLANQKLVSDAQMALCVAEYLGRPAVSLAHFTPDETLIRRLPPRVSHELQILPIAEWGDVLAVAMADPFDVGALEELQRMIPSRIVPYVAPHKEVLALLSRLRSVGAAPRLEAILEGVAEAGRTIDVGAEDAPDDEVSDEEILSMSGQAPVIRIVNSMLIEALERGASDIHIEPTEGDLCIRYRIDGVLYDQPRPPRYMQWAILSRLKIIAKIDIAERRLPQDGRFSVRAPMRDIDVRISFVPTVHGQKAVLRILDKLNLKPNVAALDLEPADHQNIARAIRQPAGLILVTGPTGSGKTTTLYSILQELNTRSVNIITIEDPVEYQLPGINQIQANSPIGLTFANGLRAVLRQDPNVIMVGEIRDGETATIAVQAALTGHLVLSTLHTNDAAGAVARLIHMGIEPFLLASSLLLSQAQRIYRKLCANCKEPREIPHEVLGLSGIPASMFGQTTLYGHRGCTHCGGIGYRGREAIMEILLADDKIAELILEAAGAATIRRYAVERGMRTLRQAGLLRVKDGHTSLEEILRVTSDMQEVAAEGSQ